VQNPFNPILGEVFKCKWNHVESQTEFVAEQITHHPPSSAFFVWNREKRTMLQAYVKSNTKFLGNSVEATLTGNLNGYIFAFNEAYEMSFPKYIVKGLLFGTMQMELGGKTTIKCNRSGFFGEFEFKTKRSNAISGKIWHTSDKRTPIYSVEGRWDQILKITDLRTKHESVLLDVTKMSPLPKVVSPIEDQQPNESRRVWGEVTKYILENKEDLALAAKSAVENEQRKNSKRNLKWEPKLFRNRGETWEYKGIEELFGDVSLLSSTDGSAVTGPPLSWLKKPSIFSKKS